MQWRLLGLRCMVVVREGFELLTIFARMTDRIPAKRGVKMHKKKIYGGKPYGLNHQQFLVENLKGDLLISLREAVQNSLEATTGPTRTIHIWVDRDGDVCVADDGVGMNPTELLKFNKDLGSGSKKQGRGKNFGIGLKLASMITETGIEIYSRPKGSRDRFQKLELGCVDDAGRHGVLHQNSKGDTMTTVAAPPAWKEYSTVVKLKGLGVDWKGIVQYLNRRYLRLPATILVAENGVTGREATWRPVRGAIECLLARSQYSGDKQYNSCRLWWGVKKETPDKALQEDFPHAPLAIGYAGEAHRWYLPMHANNLSVWGISAGTAELTLIVEATGPDVGHTIDRSAITQWDEEAAKAEVASNLPDRLLAWMKAYEAQYFDRNAPMEEVLVTDFLRRFGDELVGFQGAKNSDGKPPTRPPKPPKSKPEVDDPPKPADDDDDAHDDDDEGKPPRPPRKRSRGIPGYAFVEGRAIGGKKLQYDAAQHRILINKEGGDIQQLLDAARSDKERMKIRARAASSLIIAWVRHSTVYDEIPAQEALDAAFNGSFATALF
jgi:hypothetical protein